MIDLYLSSDGKHTVHIAAESAEELNELAPAAKALYENVIETYGNKAQMWEAVMKSENPPKTQPPTRAGEGGHQASPPRCPVHKTPMNLREGKFGHFWSCGARLPDGRWCPQTKETKSEDDIPEKIV